VSYDAKQQVYKMNGRGKLKFKNGDVYEGYFSLDKMNFEGTIWYAKGGFFKGFFKDGLKSG
jgi:hypothetical protein